ncbi:MoaD/ThiS family protein [Desulfofalx alkaliphila]|uniref:MoaD/ThiS family protein n=1 Tax=Desulfofalx alkaliphila TaxID=105483 RepID=UPI0004E14072|nr:MoaD/ThiS family protein [Desulfofalx alkaliphila]
MTVKVKVKFFAQLAAQAGCRECYLEVPGDFYQALNAVESKFNLSIIDELGTGYSVLINGKGYAYGLDDNQQLKDNDTIAFVPFLGGG